MYCWKRYQEINSQLKDFTPFLSSSFFIMVSEPRRKHSSSKILFVIMFWSNQLQFPQIGPMWSSGCDQISYIVDQTTEVAFPIVAYLQPRSNHLAPLRSTQFSYQRLGHLTSIFSIDVVPPLFAPSHQVTDLQYRLLRIELSISSKIYSVASNEPGFCHCLQVDWGEHISIAACSLHYLADNQCQSSSFSIFIVLKF